MTKTQMWGLIGGLLAAIVVPTIAVIWQGGRTAEKIDNVAAMVQRHEQQLQRLDDRTLTHGESIAAIKARLTGNASQ